MPVRAAASEGQVNGGSWWPQSQPSSGGQGRTISGGHHANNMSKMLIHVLMSAHAYRLHESFFFYVLNEIQSKQ